MTAIGVPLIARTTSGVSGSLSLSSTLMKAAEFSFVVALSSATVVGSSTGAMSTVFVVSTAPTPPSP